MTSIERSPAAPCRRGCGVDVVWAWRPATSASDPPKLTKFDAAPVDTYPAWLLSGDGWASLVLQPTLEDRPGSLHAEHACANE